MKYLTCFYALLFMFPLGNAVMYGQDSPDENSQDQDEEIHGVHEGWEQTLKFGIDTAVIAAIDEMIQQKDETFSDEVLNLLDSRRESLRTKALEYFESLELDDALPVVAESLGWYQDNDSSYNIRLLQHLSTRKMEIDDELWNILQEIIDEEGQQVRIAAIRYIGDVSYAPAADFLSELYELNDTEDTEREYIIRALGSIANPASEELILELASDEYEDNTLRIAALNAAGDFANDEALKVLSDAFSSDESLIRAAAVGSLSKFPVHQVKDLYLEALRDSFWRIRLGALQGIADNPFAEAIDAVEFMATQDPEANIKTQAFRTLAAIDRPAAWDFLRESLNDTDIGLQYRQTVAVLLIRDNFNASRSAIVEALEDQWEDNDSVLLDSICKTLSTEDLPEADDLYRRMLDHENYIIQIYGVRGIGRNHLLRFQTELQHILDSDESHPALKSNAQTALDQL